MNRTTARDRVRAHSIKVSCLLGAVALAWFLFRIHDERLHHDGIRDLLMARDCAEGHCVTIGAPTSFGDFHAGGTWIALVAAIQRIGHVIEAPRLAVIFADVIAVVLLAVHCVRRLGGWAAVVATVLFGAAVQRWALEVTVWTPALMPLWSVAVLGQSMRPPYGLGPVVGWGALLALGIDIHPMAVGVLPGVAWLVGRNARNPLSALVLLFGVAACGAVLLSPDAAYANGLAIAQARGLLSGIALVVAAGFATRLRGLMRHRWRGPAQWSDIAASRAFVLGYAAMLGAALIMSDAVMAGRYLLPIAAPLAWCVVTLAEPWSVPGEAGAQQDKDPGAATARSGRYPAVLVGTLLAAVLGLALFPNGRSGPLLALGDEAARAFAAADVPDAHRDARLQVPGCGVVAAALALHAKSRPTHDRHDARPRSSHLAWRPGVGLVQTKLRPELGRFCVRDGNARERCEDARPFEQDSRSGWQSWAAAAYPRWTSLRLRPDDRQVRFHLPIDPHVTPMAVQVLDDGPPTCAWRIIGATGLLLEGELPASQVIVRAMPSVRTSRSQSLRAQETASLELAAGVGPGCGSYYGFRGFLPCVADRPAREAQE